MSAHAQPDARLKTRWTDKVSKTAPHSEYPRPQMVRKNWTNLNGPWQFCITQSDDQSKARFDGEILVPFPVESYLSGVQKNVGAHDRLWYRRSFQRPAGDRVLLHFGACDFKTTVWVNGVEVGQHEGGYDPFSFDVTDHLKASGAQDLVVGVTDPTDAGTQPRGKQVHKPGGIFYTSNSGIWQTVWLEGVPNNYIQGLKILADPNTGQISVDLTMQGSTDVAQASIQVLDGSTVVAKTVQAADSTVLLNVQHPKLWSPETPFLYTLKIALKNRSGRIVDSLSSYTAFREVSVGKDSHGITRLCLNGKPYFMVGPLDQGFWPDGIYTAPTDDALKYDIQVTKKLGFNMIRKHVKVEPDRWYYWCDRLGILVWQDMPSGDRFISPSDPDIHRTPESAAEYEKELLAMIGAFHNHPSIVAWIPFNEGWGQFDTSRITDLIRSTDPTRLVDSTTGWADRGVGDMMDIHDYPGPSSPKPEAHRAAVLGEFGGLGLPIPGHTWQKEGWGYKSYKTRSELTEAGVHLFEHLKKLIADPGLSAAVYTQTTDVETEVNGLMTYDREILKMNTKQLRQAILDLFNP